MKEIAFITDIQHEPLALIVLGGIVLIKLIEYSIKYAPFLFARFFLNEKRMSTYEWQKFVGDKLKIIEATLEVHEFLLDKTSEGTLENILFDDNPKRSVFQRLKAFRRLIAMKKNGRVWRTGFALILENKETWIDVLDTELGIKIVDEKFFNDKLEEIETRIYRDFSKK
jgi:hypothetical protein